MVGFDIETDTTNGGLEPDTAAIVAVAISTRWVTLPASASATQPHQSPHPKPSESADHRAGDSIEHVLTGAEEDILGGVDKLLASIPSGYLVTWNGASFDLPFVARRAQLLGLDLGLELHDDPARGSGRDPGRPGVRGSWHHLVHLDGYLLYRADVGVTLGLSCGLKPLARLVGMDPVELDLSRLHLESDEAVSAYVASDARTAVDLVMRRWPQAASVADAPLPPLQR